MPPPETPPTTPAWWLFTYVVSHLLPVTTTTTTTKKKKKNRISHSSLSSCILQGLRARRTNAMTILLHCFNGGTVVQRRQSNWPPLVRQNYTNKANVQCSCSSFWTDITGGGGGVFVRQVHRNQKTKGSGDILPKGEQEHKEQAKPLPSHNTKPPEPFHSITKKIKITSKATPPLVQYNRYRPVWMGVAHYWCVDVFKQNCAGSH